jgi:YD repeat-containing protein
MDRIIETGMLKRTAYYLDPNYYYSNVNPTMPGGEPYKVVISKNKYDQAGNLYAEISGANEVEETLSVTQTQVTGVAGTVRYSVFDERGNVILSRNESGVKRWYGFNEDNRKVLEEDGLYNTLTWTFNSLGKLVSRKDLSGHQFTYEYDDFGQIKKENYYYDLPGAVNVFSIVPDAPWDSYRPTVSIRYSYYENGLLQRIDDGTDGAVQVFNSTNNAYYMLTSTRSSEYFYDIAGSRVRTIDSAIEGISGYLNSTSHETRYRYDGLGRLQGVNAPVGTALSSEGSDISFYSEPVSTSAIQQILYDYDEVGNRRAVSFSGTNHMGTSYSLKNWYKYDKSDRMLVAEGVLSGGQIVAAKEQGTMISYDYAGRRAVAESWESTTGGYEKYRQSLYGYDDQGHVISISSRLNTRALNANALASFTSDDYRTSQTYSYDIKGSRTLLKNWNADGSMKDVTSYSYRGDGMLSVQKLKDAADNLKQEIFFNINGYIDAAGMQRQYIYKNYGSTVTLGTYTLEYIGFDSYKVWTQTATINVPGYTPGISRNVYTEHGNLVSVVLDQQTGMGRLFTYNREGQIISRYDTVPNQYGFDNRQLYVYLGDKTIASIGKLAAPEFGYEFTPVSEQYPASTPGTYAVAVGDTLKSIAYMMWGDATLWYLLAEANSLSSDADLRPGEVLRIPNVVTNIHNDANAFKPYRPGEIIGDTTPEPIAPPPPPPPRKKCGGLAIAVMVIVTVVAASLTAGAAFTVLGPALSAMTAVQVGVGVTAAAVGSAAGQLVGQSLGVVDSFSWRQVGIAAVTAGMTAGVAGGLRALSSLNSTSGAVNTLSSWAGKLNSLLAPSTTGFSMTAMESYVAKGLVKYGISYVATRGSDNRQGFSWAGVGSSIVGSGLASNLNAGTFSSLGALSSYSAAVVGDTLAAAANDKWFGGSKPDYWQIAANAVASTLGEDISRNEQSKPLSLADYQQQLEDEVGSVDASFQRIMKYLGTGESTQSFVDAASSDNPLLRYGLADSYNDLRERADTPSLMDRTRAGAAYGITRMSNGAYKWVENGQVHFGDRPPALTAAEDDRTSSRLNSPDQKRIQQRHEQEQAAIDAMTSSSMDGDNLVRADLDGPIAQSLIGGAPVVGSAMTPSSDYEQVMGDQQRRAAPFRVVADGASAGGKIVDEMVTPTGPLDYAVMAAGPFFKVLEVVGDTSKALRIPFRMMPVVPSRTTVLLDSREIRSSQSYINYQRKGYNLDDTARRLVQDPLDPELTIDVVRMRDGLLTSIDNSRPAILNVQGGGQIQARLRAFDERLTDSEIGRFRVELPNGKFRSPSTWGEAVELRLSGQGDKFRRLYPNGMPEIPRIKDSPVDSDWYKFDRFPWQRNP